MPRRFALWDGKSQMKANTPELMKFKKLQRKLGESRRGTIGLLEGLWIETARNSPAGDVGRFSNEEIAIMVDWDGDPDLLVDALVECRWLDRCSEHRLVVHDWQDHCPTYVKGGLAKQKKLIAIATTPEDQAEPAQVQPIGEPIATTPEVPSTYSSQAKPSQAYPSERQDQAEDALISGHFENETFRDVWNQWLQKQSSNRGRPMDSITEQAQLYQLANFTTVEAIEIVRFSVSRTDCKNLITNGDHKPRDGNPKTNKNWIDLTLGPDE